MAIIETASRRLRRTSDWLVRQSVCFQSIPKSSSCRQTAFLIVTTRPLAVCHVAVEVVDRSQAVASQRERVGHHADAVFAQVECVLAVRRFAGSA